MIGPVLELDLGWPEQAVEVGGGARDTHLLLRVGATPIALCAVPQAPPRIDAAFASRLLVDEELARWRAAAAQPAGSGDAGKLTVAVCTRDRAAALLRCLEHLQRLDPAPAEILVVDSASADPAVAALARGREGLRYLRLERPGLSVARNVALREAATDWVAFTDDDAAVSPGWAGAIAAAVERDAGLEAVTGPVVPAAIQGPAAELFERYGGLNRGFEPKVYGAEFVRRGLRSPPTWLLGAGASMAVARRRALELGGFDPWLGAGQPAGCSEDTDLFYRVLRAGGRLRYEPAAWVWHHHRDSLADLRHQLASYGRGHAAAQWKAFRCYRDPRGLLRWVLGLPWLNARRLLRASLGGRELPVSLIAAEAWGNVVGPFLWRPSPGELDR